MYMLISNLYESVTVEDRSQAVALVYLAGLCQLLAGFWPWAGVLFTPGLALFDIFRRWILAYCRASNYTAAVELLETSTDSEFLNS